MATKAELTTDSASAATEHTEEPQLAELVTQEAGMSFQISLKIIRNDHVQYKYTRTLAGWHHMEVHSHYTPQ